MSATFDPAYRERMGRDWRIAHPLPERRSVGGGNGCTEDAASRAMKQGPRRITNTGTLMGGPVKRFEDVGGPLTPVDLALLRLYAQDGHEHTEDETEGAS